MLNCCFTIEQLNLEISDEHADEVITGCGAGTISYELASGAPFLSRNQVASVLRVVSDYMNVHGRKLRFAPNVQIKVDAAGLVALYVNPMQAC